MITVTATKGVRCSLTPQAIVSVEAGAATTVRLANGVSLDVLESVEEVLGLMSGGARRHSSSTAATSATAPHRRPPPMAPPSPRPGATHGHDRAR